MPENDILVLLTCSSIESTVHRVVTEWVLTDNGWDVYEQMIRGVQNSQTCEQLGLALAALLCYRRLLPHTARDATRTINASYLADFDALLHCKSLNNERVTLEQMLLSVLRVLKTYKDDFRRLQQFLATVLDVDTPVLHQCDGFSDRYWARRFECSLNHEDAIEMPNSRLW